MEANYSIAVHRKLEEAFQNLALLRPMNFERYEADTELIYDVTGLVNAQTATVRLRIIRFVGGGFAGQVYQVQILAMESAAAPINDLEVGGVYAMKLLIPPSGFSRLFRNLLYWIGFQGPFQLQVNPAAAKAGALWQKFIRRGAKITFGDDTAVADIHAVFVDAQLGTCGELSEWVEGRTWRLEVDDHLDVLKRWMRGKRVDPQKLGSPEYRAKYEFMHQLVGLLHQMGAHEFARQYEWSTWKSQPNCLKRKDTETPPFGGLTAVDFRAGLALLPFLPMSPGDFKLILTGIMRGSLVQFDRGDIKRLEQYIQAHTEEFADMKAMLSDLKFAEQVYRNSVPDVTHNHVRLVYSRQLWATILASAINAWRTRNLINEPCRAQLQKHRGLAVLFAALGLIPWLGRFCRRIWGQVFWRSHYRMMLTDWRYLRKAVRAKLIEKLIGWHRSGRVDDPDALKISMRIWKCAYHWPLSLLPAGIHKFITNWQYAKNRLDYLLLRPIRLYFDNDLREQWLQDMVTQGREKHLLSSADAGVILAQIKEPFIQKYLKSLAVHVCTLPVTQVVSVLLAAIYVLTHPELPRTQAYAIGLGIIALFQVVPISPGSLVRGLYVLYLVIKEKNFKDYNIAVFLGFFKYIGYLAFPIQMTYRYPALARFMAGHWATEAVYIVPVFGERGALLEHKIFCLFYNWPLTMRRRMRMRSANRAATQPRYWHMVLCALVGVGVFVATDLFYVSKLGKLPGLKEMWMIALTVPLLCGAAVTLGAGGAAGWKRMIGAVVCGIIIGVFSTVVSAGFASDNPMGISEIAITGIWRAFVFTLLSVLGLMITEIGMPETNSIYKPPTT